jgi:hypothetical protein
MAKLGAERKKVVKRTCQGGSKPKTSSMNKTTKSGFKAYRGQGK